MKTKIFLLIFLISVIGFCLCSFTPYEEFDLNGEFQIYSDIHNRVVTDGMPSGTYNLPNGACKYNTPADMESRFDITQIVFDSSNSRVTIYPGAKVIIDGGIQQSSSDMPILFFFDSSYEISEDIIKFFYLNHGVGISELLTFDFSDSIQDFNTLPFGYEVDKTGAHGFELIGNYSINSEVDFNYIYLYSGNMRYVNTNSENGDLFNNVAYSYSSGWSESYKNHILGIENTFVGNWLLWLFEANQETLDNRLFISGKRYFNDVLDLSFLGADSTELRYIYSGASVPGGFSAVFESNSKTYVGMISDYGDSIGYFYDFVYSFEAGWNSQDFRIVDFGTGYYFEPNSVVYYFIIANSRDVSGTDYDKGYSDGYNNAITDNVFGEFFVNMFTTPVLIMNGIVLLEYDGVVITIWSVMCTLFVVMFTLWLLKLLAGG